MSSSTVKPETWDRADNWSDASGQQERWPIPRTALFVGAASIALWGSIFALISWLF